MAVKGFVEFVSRQQVRGWVADQEHPGVHMNIVVLVRATKVASARADLYRDDLKEARVGGGDHGFVINFDPMLREEDLAGLEIEAAAPMGESVRLKWLVDRSSTNAPAPPPAPRAKQITAGEAVQDLTQFPVFVLGAARSGTSAVAQALLKTGYYAGHEEGHVLALMAQQMAAIRHYYASNGEDALPTRDTTLARIPQEYFLNAVADSFKNLVPHLWQNKHWIDKTPNDKMVAASPLFLRLWPNARFIFMRRRALENVMSRMRKFPQISFAAHCTDWATVMRTWGATRSRLGGRAIEIEQLELATRPEAVAARLAQFLDLPAPVASRLGQALLVDRPERTSQNFATPLSMQALNWPEARIETFKTVCGPQLLEYGYSLDERYYARSPSAANDVTLKTASSATP